ncbi:MAG: hypothetical protein ABL889_21210 [Terricaulis sp.]
MGRRYLTIDEALFALKRGKAIECFLGPCARGGAHGIRHASITLVGDKIQLRVFETADKGNATFLDLYEFGPLDPSLAPGDADEISAFPTWEACVAAMRARWPERASRLVNEGVLQDEYCDYVAGGRRA